MFREISRGRSCSLSIGVGWLAAVIMASFSLVSCGSGGGGGAAATADATQQQQQQPTSQAASQATLTAAPGMSEAIVSWPSAPGAVSYNLYWGTASGVTTANGTRIDGVTAPYAHMGLTDSVDYHYIVTAVMADGSETALWPEAHTVSGSCH